ncbi:hypothetical protein [Cyanobium sp. ATX 6F1]|uniref:hypothetical protein n=1 Tax=unclassified Cyanobium TaxID=2627006 RepID=UPI0020CD861C|nr:hypothetical protein [Cyanobium sp. ATX 6F1]MCP9916859.1 hypothetical protein [Cyanobium sp. ATX 6F1]
MTLESLELWFELAPGLLRPQVLAALAPHGEPLRWALTAVEVEVDGARRARLEAVVLR